MPGFCQQLLAFTLALGPRGFKPHAPKPPHAPGETDLQALWYFVEDHGDIIFPALALVVVALIAFGIRRGMKSNVAELHEHEAHKDAIVRMMRQKLLVSPETVAGELHIDRFLASALLEELVKEGKLAHQVVAGGVANYRLKGL